MTESTSLPVPVPWISRPMVNALPFFEIEVGVAVFKIALPLATCSLKSATSRSPFPLLCLKTISEKVTVAVLLSLATATLEMVGANLSINVLLLVLCEVVATLPAKS